MNVIEIRFEKRWCDNSSLAKKDSETIPLGRLDSRKDTNLAFEFDNNPSLYFTTCCLLSKLNHFCL